VFSRFHLRPDRRSARLRMRVRITSSARSRSSGSQPRRRRVHIHARLWHHRDSVATIMRRSVGFIEARTELSADLRSLSIPRAQTRCAGPQPRTGCPTQRMLAWASPTDRSHCRNALHAAKRPLMVHQRHLSWRPQAARQYSELLRATRPPHGRERRGGC